MATKMAYHPTRLANPFPRKRVNCRQLQQRFATTGHLNHASADLGVVTRARVTLRRRVNNGSHVRVTQSKLASDDQIMMGKRPVPVCVGQFMLGAMQCRNTVGQILKLLTLKAEHCAIATCQDFKCSSVVFLKTITMCPCPFPRGTPPPQMTLLCRPMGHWPLSPIKLNVSTYSTIPME